MKTGFVTHEKYLWHDTKSAALYMPAVDYVEPEAHTEGPESKRRFRNLLEVSGVLDQLTRIKPRPATEEEILRFHTRDYLDSIIARSNDNGGDAQPGGGAPFSVGAYEIAALSAGGVIAAFDGVLTGSVKNAYALVRPPGHHALAHEGCGFCLFGNAVIAIKHAMIAHHVERIVTIDWDVHHGNGTESAFYDDPNVLTISIHQDENFPHNSGHGDRNGEGDGAGYNINIPLPAGSGRGAYRAIMERVISPAVRAFKPDLIVIPCGFDANAYDPLGRMLLSSGAYVEMTRHVMDLANEVCNDRLVMCHEGGYSSAYVPFCGQAVVEEMAGIIDPITDPFLEAIEGMAGQDLLTHQDTVITKAAEIANRI